jgi:transcriptional regulator with XRE-family HTH domain
MTTKAEQAMFQKMSVGDRVRYLMEKREIKQTELAAKIGVGQAAISNIVTDASRKPSAPTLLAIAGELQCNPNWILTGEGDPYAWAPVTSESHVQLLNLFNGLSEEGRKALLAVAKTMAPK